MTTDISLDHLRRDAKALKKAFARGEGKTRARATRTAFAPDLFAVVETRRVRGRYVVDRFPVD